MIPGPKGLGCTSPGGLWEVGSQGTGEQGRATERAVTPGRLLHSAKTGADSSPHVSCAYQHAWGPKKGSPPVPDPSLAKLPCPGTLQLSVLNVPLSAPRNHLK